MVYGYALCLNDEDVDRQQRKLEKFGVSADNICIDSRIEAIQLELHFLLDSAKAGDTIITTEVSRLACSVKQLCETIELVKKKKLLLIIGAVTVDCRHDLAPMTDGMLNMVSVFTELERNIKSQRVKAGMESARAKGVKLGRPAITIEDIPAEFFKHIDKYMQKQINQEELARRCKKTRQTISKYIQIYREAKKEERTKRERIERRKAAEEEEERLSDYKNMSDDSLRILAEDEATTAWHEGISKRWTPASHELKRREKRLPTDLEPIQSDIDLSEFD